MIFMRVFSVKIAGLLEHKRILRLRLSAKAYKQAGSVQAVCGMTVVEQQINSISEPLVVRRKKQPSDDSQNLKTHDYLYHKTAPANTAPQRSTLCSTPMLLISFNFRFLYSNASTTIWRTISSTVLSGA